MQKKINSSMGLKYELNTTSQFTQRSEQANEFGAGTSGQRPAA